MTRPCHWHRDPHDGKRYFIPGCFGTMHVDEHDEDIMSHCNCERPPKYKRGAKANIARLIYRIDLLEARIIELEKTE